MPFDAENFQPVRLLDRDPKTITDPKERLMYLRDFLRERVEPQQFDMRTFGRNADTGATRGVRISGDACGTAACIAGWTNLLWAQRGQMTSAHRRAAGFIGLDGKQAEELFWPWPCSAFYSTPAQAANVLDHLIQTGEVDWSKV